MTAGNEAPRIVVVGSVMTDLITYADPLPETGETVVGTAFEIGCGGKGANQALTAHRLGATVTFVARVGRDPFGDMNIGSLKANGINSDRVRAVEGASTGVAPIWVTSDGNNRIIVVSGANQAVTAEVVRSELEGLQPVDSMICQLEIPDDAVAEALSIGARLGATTIINPAPAHREAVSLFGDADWVVPNESEFQTLWGAGPSDANILAAAGAWGCGVIVTLGADGAAASTSSGVIHVPPPAAKVVDTTGAGDAFVGGLAFALSSGLSLREAVELGNTCGSLSTEVRGTQSSFPTRDSAELRWGRTVAARATAEPRVIG